MPRRALILTAGTLLSILTSPQTAAAISPQQSPVTNNQAQLANVVADQTLNVVDVSDSTTQSAVAEGNTFTGSIIGSPLNVQSVQTMSGNASATGRVNVTTNSAVTTIDIAATGNNSESNVLGGGTLTGTSSQTTGAVNILALGEYNGANAQAGDLSNSAQAVANSQGYGLTHSTADATLTQSSAAITQSDAGLTLGYTAGTALIAATATSNNVTAEGITGSSQTLSLTQSMTGARTQATVNANAGNAQTILGQASTIANNISVTNQGGPLNVVTDQTNTGYVQSQSVVTAFEFGTAQSTAYGVGNSVMVGNQGQQLSLTNTQTNSGNGIEAQASFSSGAGGYDATSSSIAIGNAVTGYACSQCSGRMTVANRQTNSADVGATSTATVSASNRSATGTAAATGNAASFYVSSPSGN
jgi:hypothetical protein